MLPVWPGICPVWPLKPLSWPGCVPLSPGIPLKLPDWPCICSSGTASFPFRTVSGPILKVPGPEVQVDRLAGQEAQISGREVQEGRLAGPEAPISGQEGLGQGR